MADWVVKTVDCVGSGVLGLELIGKVGEGGIVCCIDIDSIGLDGLAGLRRCPVLLDLYSTSTFASIQPEKPVPLAARG